MSQDLFASDLPDNDPQSTVMALLSSVGKASDLKPLKIDYPFEGSVFPPDMCAPTFLWHDEATESQCWLVDISFANTPRHIRFLTAGKRKDLVIDPAVASPLHEPYETDYQKSGKGWTPDDRVWAEIKRCSVDEEAHVTIMGLPPIAQNDSPAPRILSKGEVRIKTSKDPVAAPIFYRDVPLMPSAGKDGVIQPIPPKLFSLIKWHLRDLSQPTAKVVMTGVVTCINCHSFSTDGKVMGADMDGPDGDKGAYFTVPVSSRMVVKAEHGFTWSSFSELPKGERTFGLFARVSPDGRYVAVQVTNDLFVENYLDYRFLQSFYPVRGIMGYRDLTTGEIKCLPGADASDYLQGNPFWTPDGQNIVFSRAKAISAHGPRPKQANGPEEPPIQYDLYQIPFNEGKGGVAAPIEGASNNGKSNSMPAVSPDGKWLVYVQCARGMVMRPDSRLYIVPARGGQAREMRCNMSLMNSWHSWSPNSRWLVFSSKGNRPFTQLFLTHVDENGEDTPAILIPDSTDDNRAANIPEFVNIAPDGIEEISVPAIEYRVHVDKAQELRKKERFEEALDEARKSLELKEDYPETQTEMGWLLHKTGKTGEAIPYFKRALELDSRSSTALNSWGAVLMDSGKLEEAMDKFKTCLSFSFGEDRGKVYRNMAWTYFLMKNPKDSVAYCEEALALNQKDADAQRLWGDTLLYLLNDPVQAADRYQKAMELDPKLKEVHLGLGDSLVRQSRYEEAMRQYEEAKALDPNYSKVYNLMGNALNRCGKFEEALAQYKRAHELQPRDKFVLHNIGMALANLERYPEAIEFYLQAIAIDPNYGSAYNYLGNAFLAIGKTDDAIAAYRKALEVDAADCYTRDNLGAALLKIGKRDEARAQLEEALHCADETGNKQLADAIRKELPETTSRPQ